MTPIAIIGSTASGKSALAMQIAIAYQGVILSLDTLSIYKHINIASAKPTTKEREQIKHFGIDICYPDEPFGVMDFIHIYETAQQYATIHKRPLIIVGGSSFYLKTLIEGLSPVPKIDESIKQAAQDQAQNLAKSYDFLQRIDPSYMKNIKPQDRYRITKSLELYLSTQMPMSNYFKAHPKVPIIKDLSIYHLSIDKTTLRAQIIKRLEQMIDSELLPEIEWLYNRYDEGLKPMQSIGIKEGIAFLKGVYSFEEMKQQIINHTWQLSKRQRTFNTHQFKTTFTGTPEHILKLVKMQQTALKVCL